MSLMSWLCYFLLVYRGQHPSLVSRLNLNLITLRPFPSFKCLLLIEPVPRRHAVIMSAMVQDRIKREKTRSIESIDHNAILELASSHHQNLLWDQYLHLVGVIDWEWSHVVPLQLFTPLVWLENVTLPFLAFYQEDYAREVGYLLEAIKRAEATHYGTSTLSNEWDEV